MGWVRTRFTAIQPVSVTFAFAPFIEDRCKNGRFGSQGIYVCSWLTSQFPDFTARVIPSLWHESSGRSPNLCENFLFSTRFPPSSARYRHWDWREWNRTAPLVLKARSWCGVWRSRFWTVSAYPKASCIQHSRSCRSGRTNYTFTYISALQLSKYPISRIEIEVSFY